MVTLGKLAPLFCLPDGDGKSVCLKELQGRWVVLYFYPKDDTPGCTLEAIDFTRNLEGFGKRNAVVLGVSPDSKESHCRFRDKHGLKVRLLSDTDHGVLETYGVWVEKNIAGKTVLGVERSTFLIGPDGTVKALWNKVKVAGHIDSVLEKMDSLR
jgi:thioredoxin-dependent peroxiredoxin